jgi:hypothetical protein
MDEKQNERRHRLMTHLWCQQYGAEEFGWREEVADWEALADQAHEVFGQVGSADRNDLYCTLGAPFYPVDLHKYLAHPIYSCHIDSPRIPPALKTEHRNRRIELFHEGDTIRRSALAGVLGRVTSLTTAYWAGLHDVATR